MYPDYVYTFEGRYTYRITVELGSVVQITFDHCVLKRDSKVVIYDGFDDTISEVLFTQETDSTTSESIISSTNVVFVAFSINTFSESKFKLTWSQVAKVNRSDNTTYLENLNCTSNSIINLNPRDRHQIKSPGYPDGYDVNQNCKWTFIPSAAGYHVTLVFSALDLEPTSNCIADYVTVSSSRDMVHFNDSSQLCSLDSESSTTIYHGTPNLKVEFKSDFYLNKTGFMAEVTMECGGLMEGPSGVINHYMALGTADRLFSSQQSCLWQISVKRGRTIQFQFMDYVTMKKNSDGSCANYLLIRNGPDEDSPFLGNGKYCESRDVVLPKTTSNKAYVKYVRESASSIGEDIFRLQYRQVEHDCGEEVSLSTLMNSTTITTPNYPNIPSPHIECIWKITAPNGELIKIDFVERFDLTTSKNCTQEYLEIRDGTTTAASLLGKFCNEMPSTQLTTSNMARLHYFTDVTVPKNGFKAVVSIAKCGGSFNGWSGIVSSSNYPGLGKFIHLFLQNQVFLLIVTVQHYSE